MDLTSYRPLGRSGLVVSPLCLGTMTFGTPRWGVDGEAARTIFNTYLDVGGNFVDTAEVYAGGRSEELVGELIADADARDRIVLATKFTWNLSSGTPGFSEARRGNPNAGGNGRKNILRALDGSLKRLRTDYVDVYWLHFWDMVTPVEEVLDTLVDLVRSGRIRYYALSDVPAWYMARMATLAEARGVPGPIALQTQYSLVERSAEYEHLPATRELGIGVMPWSPLAGGFLSGKYRQGENETAAAKGDGRLAGDNPLGQTPFTARNWAILDTVRRVAEEVGCSPAEVALAWIVGRTGVASTLIGATRPDQLSANLGALHVDLSGEQRATLDKASAPAEAFPWSTFTSAIRRSLFGGADVERWSGR